MFGHPLHPAVVHFPIALLLSASAADIAWLVGFTADVRVGAVMMAGGLAMGIVAMAAGLVDFIRLDEGAVPHAMRHILVVGVAWMGYAIALYLRRDTVSGGTELSSLSIALSMVSALLLALGGWLGGRLVYTFGAGVATATKSAGSQSPG
jgi:uncharacterized membrane protein